MHRAFLRRNLAMRRIEFADSRKWRATRTYIHHFPFLLLYPCLCANCNNRFRPGRKRRLLLPKSPVCNDHPPRSGRSISLECSKPGICANFKLSIHSILKFNSAYRRALLALILGTLSGYPKGSPWDSCNPGKLLVSRRKPPMNRILWSKASLRSKKILFRPQNDHIQQMSNQIASVADFSLRLDGCIGNRRNQEFVKS